MSSLIDVSLVAAVVIVACGAVAMVAPAEKKDREQSEPEKQTEAQQDVPAQSPISSDEFRIKKIEQKLSVQGQKIDQLDEKLNLLLANPPTTETDNGRREPRRQN